jgi:hypothetical protein
MGASGVYGYAAATGYGAMALFMFFIAVGLITEFKEVER